VTAVGGATPSGVGLTRVSEISVLIRISFVMRLATLLASLLGFVGRELTLMVVGSILFLAATSMTALTSPGAVELLQRHPILVVLDSLVVTGLLLALGVDNPLVLCTLSSSVIIGVMLGPLTAALSTVVLVTGYLAAATEDSARASFVTLLGLPITYICVAVLAQAFRVVGQRKRQSERAFVDSVSSVSAAEERSRLARELHDSTAKTLQGLSLGARALAIWIERDPARAVEEAEGIAESADEAICQLRRLLSTLRQDCSEQPFAEAVSALARDLEQIHGVRVRADLADVAVTDSGVRYELLAAAREAVSNAATHSGCEVVALRLRGDGQEVVVEVADDGCGFWTDGLSERERAGHFGVRGYVERMTAVGGTADVETAPGRGTRVTLRAPVAGLRERQLEART